jgi:nitroreductase
MDAYQERYLKHRERKKQLLEKPSGDRKGYPICLEALAVMQRRRSVRAFKQKPLDFKNFSNVILTAICAPQSCNRQALTLLMYPGKEVGEYLLGGKGWAEKAIAILLLLADMKAYKSPREVDFMPWLDAGVMLAAITYAATACGIGSCIINPSLQEETASDFQSRFNPESYLFCGAVALGYPAAIPKEPEKKHWREFIRWQEHD